MDSMYPSWVPTVARLATYGVLLIQLAGFCFFGWLLRGPGGFAVLLGVGGVVVMAGGIVMFFVRSLRMALVLVVCVAFVFLAGPLLLYPAHHDLKGDSFRVRWTFLLCVFQLYTVVSRFSLDRDEALLHFCATPLHPCRFRTLLRCTPLWITGSNHHGASFSRSATLGTR